MALDRHVVARLDPSGFHGGVAGARRSRPAGGAEVRIKAVRIRGCVLLGRELLITVRTNAGRAIDIAFTMWVPYANAKRTHVVLVDAGFYTRQVPYRADDIPMASPSPAMLLLAQGLGHSGLTPVTANIIVSHSHSG